MQERKTSTRESEERAQLLLDAERSTDSDLLLEPSPFFFGDVPDSTPPLFPACIVLFPAAPLPRIVEVVDPSEEALSSDPAPPARSEGGSVKGKSDL